VGAIVVKFPPFFVQHRDSEQQTGIEDEDIDSQIFTMHYQFATIFQKLEDAVYEFLFGSVLNLYCYQTALKQIRRK
jgi:hypothetical protein